MNLLGEKAGGIVGKDDPIAFKQYESRREIIKSALMETALSLWGPAVGIATFYFANGATFLLTKPSVTPSLVSALISYAVTVPITDIWKAFQVRRRSHDLNRAILTEIEAANRTTTDAVHATEKNLSKMLSSFNVTALDEPEAKTRVFAAVIASKRVRNTFVNLRHLTGTRTAQTRDIVSRYETFLSKGNDVEWHDVVGMPDFFDGRFSTIFANQIPAQCGKLKITILNSHTPIVNFCLTAPNASDFTDLYFGWIADHEGGVKVYHSTDHGLIRLFNNHFHELTNGPDARNLDISYSNPHAERFKAADFHDFIGRWISVSTEKPRDPINVSGPIDYSDINISFDKTWKIEGFYKGRKKRIGHIVSTHSVLVKNTIYYMFKSWDQGEDPKTGIGEWTLPELARADPLQRSEMTGFYCHNKDTHKRFTTAWKIDKGVKVSENFVQGLIEDAGMAKSVIEKRN